MLNEAKSTDLFCDYYAQWVLASGEIDHSESG